MNNLVGRDLMCCFSLSVSRFAEKKRKGGGGKCVYCCEVRRYIICTALGSRKLGYMRRYPGTELFHLGQSQI